MAKDVGLKAEAALQNKLVQRLMLERTLEAADRMVACLEDLHAQFPSHDLREALHNTTGWRDRLRDSLGLQRRSAGSPSKLGARDALDEKTPLDPSIPDLANDVACARASLRIIIRPRLTTFNVGVHAISTTQVDLVAHAAIEPGTTIAIRWDYGPHQCWRTVLAVVAGAVPSNGGRWIVTCVFNKPLHAADVEALQKGDRRPDWACE
jgi:hypothetical protein